MPNHKTRDRRDRQPHPAMPISPDPDNPPAGILRRARARPKLGANDGPADDFITLAEGWHERHDLLAGTPEAAAAPASPTAGALASPLLALDAIAGQFSAREMRQLGASLMKLADSLDDQWNPDELRASYNWLTQPGRIERQALSLAQVALRLRSAARRRCRHLSGEWFGEPAWEMLLELFIQFAGGARVSTKSLVISSGAPDTTALRVLDRLEEAGLIERAPSQMDKRVTLIGLTRDGVVAVGMVLTEAEA